MGSQALLLPGSQRRPAGLAALTPVRSPAPATQSGEPITVTRAITYTYDPLNRLTGATYSTGESFEYVYDQVDNRTAMTATQGVAGTTVTTYTYDSANRLTKVGDVTYTWDDRGNLIGDGTFTYTYNAAGRMVRAESVTVTLVYTYSADGLRVAQNVNGSVMTTTWDLALGLAQVLATGDGARDVYGLGRIAEVRGGEWAYPLPDALGSVRQWTDDAGIVTYAAGYTPFGEELWHTGSAASAWGYTGEWQDADVGLLYLRARWYCSQIGGFLSRDPIESEPPYQYVRGNPINRTDPSGHFPMPWTVGKTQFYSCKCGWIDTNHATSKYNLIKRVRDIRESALEWGLVSQSANTGPELSNPLLAYGSFMVRRQGVMDDNSANEVALGIYIAWENFFEESQGFRPTNPAILSSFSQEDLVSDLIGFHRGLDEIEGKFAENSLESLEYFMDKCEVVGYDEFYGTDKATFEALQQQIYWEYLDENPFSLFEKLNQWGVRPSSRWSGAIVMHPVPAFDWCMHSLSCYERLSCDEQQEQLPAELLEVRPQEPGRNWTWYHGQWDWTEYKEYYPQHMTKPFSANELNQRPLNWAGP